MELEDEYDGRNIYDKYGDYCKVMIFKVFFMVLIESINSLWEFV